jgi:hypothetical protein
MRHKNGAGDSFRGLDKTAPVFTDEERVLRLAGSVWYKIEGGWSTDPNV